MKICANGEMPFRNNRHCKDGSNPRCPIAVTPSSTSEAPLNIVTPAAFSTGKPVETIKPRKDNLVQTPEVTLFTGELPGFTSFTGSYQGPTSFTGQASAPTTTGHSTTWHKDPFPTGVVHPSKGVGEVGVGKQAHPTAAAKKGEEARIGIHGGGGDLLLTDTHLVGIQASHI